MNRITPATRSIPHHRHDRRVVQGHKLPDDDPVLSENERSWLTFLRDLAGDRDPPVSLAGVDALRHALRNG
jgi:hypothetical protein